MKQDERNLPLSTDSAEAVTQFDRAVEHFLKFHADTMALAGGALAADPDFVMGHCLRAYLLLIAANPANRAQIDATLARARAGAATITTRERMHLAAVEAIRRIKAELRAFRKKIQSIASADAGEDMVYQLNLHLIPLTRRQGTL